MSFESPISDRGTEMERDQALADARDIIRERGVSITVRLHSESKIDRDRYNSIKKRDTDQTPGFEMYAFPVVFNPTTKQLDDAGIKENVQVLIKTSVLEWTTNNITVDNLNHLDSIRATIILNGSKYEIRDKQFDSQYQDTYLYIHIGLNKV